MKNYNSYFKLIAILLLLLFNPFQDCIFGISICYPASQTDTLVMQVGDRKILFPDVDRSLKLQWSTGNQDVVTVDESGEAHAVGSGNTYVSMYSTTIQKFVNVFVEALPDMGETTNVLPSGDNKKAINPNSYLVLDQIVRERHVVNIDSRLEVSDNKRYLVIKDTGEPFLFLSQTLWSITRQLNREEIIRVLDICKSQGFTTIQLIAHSHYMGPNVYGASPFIVEDFTRPDLNPGSSIIKDQEYDWWDHLEFIIGECVARELTVCLLPTWREQWNQKNNLNMSNAFAYGSFIGARYRHLNPWIIWVLGGDAAPNTREKLSLHGELARGIAQGVNGKVRYDNLMMTYHTHGPTSTTDFIPPGEPYMDFHTIQSGHSLKNLEGMMERTYKSEEKPVLDFEPLYGRDGQNTHEVRTTIYWGIFSGGFGVSYGSWNTWHCGERNDLAQFSIPEAFQLGFEEQVKHLGKLLLYNECFSRIPDQSLLVDNQNSGFERVLACRAADNSYCMVYSPAGKSFKVDLSLFGWRRVKISWFNPREGTIEDVRTIRVPRNMVLVNTPPTSGAPFTGNDWVLIVQQADR